MSKISTGATKSAVACAAVAGLLLGAPAAASGAEDATVARWNMNEASGATTMTDSSGNGIDGAIGSAVVVTGNGYYNWTNVKPNEPPAKPERLVRIDDARLNPGTRDYAVTFRYRTTRSFGNIMQKGQATTPGGQWKVQLPKGQVSCLYRGAAGKRAIKSLASYADGQWHTVRCERTASGVKLSIYDAAMNLQESRYIKGATGDLTNNKPMTIGGKSDCDQITVTCDYFAGDIDFVHVEAT